MKPTQSLRLLGGSLAALLTAWMPARAADVTWNLASGGAWDTVTANWLSGSGLYANGDNAIFNNTVGGVITLSGTIAPASTTVSATGSGTYTFGGAGITSGTLTKINAGSLTLNFGNTHSGLTDVRGGTLTYGVADALGAGDVRIDARSADIGYARINIGANNDTVGTVTVDGEGRLIGTTGVLTSTGSFEMKRGFASAILDGSGVALNKTTGGLFGLTNANTYTGTTTVSQGVLRLSHATALPGGILNTGGTSALTINGGVVELGNGDFQRDLGTGSAQFQITGGVSGFSASGAARIVTVNNNAAQELVWGTSTFAPSTLVLNESTANNTLTLTNRIDLNGATRTIASNAATTGGSIATISGVIRNGGGSAAGITKTGVGTLVLNAINSYDGTTTVSGGVLNIQNADALGSTTAGTIVSSGASLQIQGGITTAAEALTLNGTGVVNNYNNVPTTTTGYVSILTPGTTTLNNTGALRSISGDNTYAGVVTLGSASRIQSDTAGSKLTLSAGVTGTNVDLTVGGVGNTSITAVTTGSGKLTMHGTAGAAAGTLTLTGASTYTGKTTVRGGIINLTGSLNGGTGTDLDFKGAGTFNVTDTSQAMGALTTSNGDATISSTRTTGTLTQSFTSLNARPSGVTRSFLTNGGTIGTDNKIVLSGQTTGFMGTGTFAGSTTGNSYAWYDAGGYVRPYASGDANYFSAPGGATMGAAATDNVALGGAITAQTTTSVNTINMGANNFAVTAANTVSTDGLLSSGSASATFGPNTSFLQAATSGGELVVRVNGSTDVLTVNSVIQNNSSASALTKSGAGTLLLSKAPTYTGTTTVAGGILKLGNLLNAGGGATLLSTSVVVDGAELQNAGGNDYYLGRSGTTGTANNTLAVRNGGKMSLFGSLYIGNDVGSDNNAMIIDGVGSTYLTGTGSSNKFHVGVSGDNNSLTISNGGHFRSQGSGGTTNTSVGQLSGADGNSITVTGVGSTLSTSGQRLTIGGAGGTLIAPNTMTISAGGQVIARVGHVGGETAAVAAGSYNKVTIDGTNSLWSLSEDLTVGRGVGTNNGVIVQNGGTLFAKPRNDRSGTERAIEIGSSNGSNNNYVTVTGAGSRFVVDPGNSAIGTATGIMTGVIGLDAGATGNAVNVQNGGTWAMNWRLELGGIDSAVNLGNGAGFAKSYGTFQDVVMNTDSARVNIDNAELKFTQDLAAVSGLGKVQLDGAAYISTTFSNTISTEITGNGSLDKEGTGTLDLTYANTYTGETLVHGGVLQLENAFLADAAAVRLFSGGQLNLNFDETGGQVADTVGALYINNVLQASGTWGATGSGAININDMYFSGVGVLNVIPEPAAALLGSLGLLATLRRRRMD